MTDDEAYTRLRQRVRDFNAERGWTRYHDPKSLILALVGEVGELAELFQWVEADRAVAEFTDPDRRRRAAEEMSDVFIYLLCLADQLDIELVAASHEKLSEAAQRYPAVDGTETEAPRKA